MSEKLRKEELIKLVEKICNPKLSEEVVSEYIDILEQNVPHPAPSDLIFWSDTTLTPEEIVEIALNYKETDKRK
ncbi:bacteriocin immunity protein [Brevibacillus laterosporus]|uniref:bacteriocin immunity protein n=1 Tax=Brevibacillus laterosporus TaxID=1465 RepID=UPI002E23974A|nr:bacteriocin immunity protein [Brevibacillus laterosporus]